MEWGPEVKEETSVTQGEPHSNPVSTSTVTLVEHSRISHIF